MGICLIWGPFVKRARQDSWIIICLTFNYNSWHLSWESIVWKERHQYWRSHKAGLKAHTFNLFDLHFRFRMMLIRIMMMLLTMRPHDWVSPPPPTFLITMLDLTCFLSTYVSLPVEYGVDRGWSIHHPHGILMTISKLGENKWWWKTPYHNPH